jgi:hypothetical protein
LVALLIKIKLISSQARIGVMTRQVTSALTHVGHTFPTHIVNRPIGQQKSRHRMTTGVVKYHGGAEVSYSGAKGAT